MVNEIPDGNYIIQNLNLVILSINPLKQIIGSGMNYAALDSQLFTVKSEPSSTAYTITHISTGDVVEVAGGNSTPGMPVVLASRTGGNNQLWEIQPVIGFKFDFRPNVSAKSLKTND